MHIFSHMAQRYRTLADYFEQTGRTHRSLAIKLGVDRSYISLLVSRNRQPSLPMAIEIAKYTGVPLESLLMPPQEVAS